MDELPAMQSWATQALQLFDEERRELHEALATLQAAHESEMKAARTRITAEVEAQLRRDYPALATASTRRQNKPRTAGGAAAASQNNTISGSHAPAMMAAAVGGSAQENYLAQIAEERERGIGARLDELEQHYNAQVWRSLVRQSEDELRAVQQAVEPVQAWCAKEYAFFSARPSAAYTMDDILGTGRVRSNNNTTSTSSAGGGSSAEGTAPANFTIDAVAFAEEYNAALQREYGYKPILNTSRSTSTRTDISPASSFAAHTHRVEMGNNAEDEEGKGHRSKAATTVTAAAVGKMRKGSQSLRERLRSHVPADCEPDRTDTLVNTTTREGGEAAAAAAVLPPASCAAVPLPALASHKTRDTPEHTNGTPLTAARTASAMHEGDAQAASLPPLVAASSPSPAGAAATAVQKTRTKAASNNGSEEEEEGSTAHKAARTKKAKHTSTAPAHAPPLPCAGIECSLTDRTLHLESCTDDEVQATVRFTNRNAYRTRLRLHAATHPWLTYRCTRFAPVAGGTTKPSNEGSEQQQQQEEQGVLSCGGYMEVAVSFSPQDLTEARLQSLLRVGVTRELNARSAEGARWHFVELRVECVTLLPCFELRCEEELSTPSTTAEEHNATSTNGCGAEDNKRSTAVPRRGKRGSPSPHVSNQAHTSVNHSTMNSTSVAMAECVFAPTFVMASREMCCQLVNVGSTAMINLLSSSPAFVVQPAATVETLVPHGDCMDLRIAFSPLSEGSCDGELTVAMREDSAGSVVREQIFALRGTGLVPRVQLTRIGDTPIAHHHTNSSSAESEAPQWLLTAGSGAARYLLPSTTPHVTSTTTVVVRNETAVALPFHWRATKLQESEEGDVHNTPRSDVQEEKNNNNNSSSISGKKEGGDEDRLTLRPASGLLPAQAEMHFTLELTPHSTNLIYAAWSLFIDGLPDPAALSPARQALVAEEVLHMCSRRKRIPCRAAEAHTTSALSVDFFSDPFAVFRQCTCMQSATREAAVYATGFYVFAQPAVPQATLQPAVLRDEMGCLVGQGNVRRVTLHNASSRPMHFTMERLSTTTTPDNYNNSNSSKRQQQARQEADSRAVELSCTPARGVVPAGGSVELTVQYTLHGVGRYHVELGCRIAEVMACLPHSAPCSHCLMLELCGVGPTVRTDTRLLDFGLIELHEEAQASFTIVSDHVAPITVDIKEQTSSREASEPRFRVAPTTCRLTCNGTARVTVYRTARAVDDTRGFLELHIRGNAHNPALVLETCCSVQRADVRLREQGLRFGVVPEAVWQAAELHLDNHTDLDTEYQLVQEGNNNNNNTDNNSNSKSGAGQAARVEFDLPAGWQKIARRARGQCIPLRVRFFRAASTSLSSSSPFVWTQAQESSCYTRLLVQLRKGTQTLALPVSCAAVEALTVSVDVLQESNARLQPEAVLDHVTASASVHTSEDAVCEAHVQAETSMSSFVQALLWNALELAWYQTYTYTNNNNAAVVSSSYGARPPMGAQTNSASTRVLSSSSAAAMTMSMMSMTGGGLQDTPRAHMLQLLRSNTINNNTTMITTSNSVSGALLRSYGGVVELTGEMPEEQPYYATSIALCVRNYTGCTARCIVCATHYIALPETEETQPHTGSAGSTQRQLQRSNPRFAGTTGLSSNVSGGNGSKQRLQSAHKPLAQTLASRLCHTLRSNTTITNNNNSSTSKKQKTTMTATNGTRGVASVTQTLPVNSLLATTDTAGFWASMETGAAQVQQMHRTRLDEVTQCLLDGRGCATLVASADTPHAASTALVDHTAEQSAAATASTTAMTTMMQLGPRGCLTWPVTFLSNLPGCYRENLLVHFDQSALAPLVLPVRLTLHGKPLLLDPTTSGLTRYTTGGGVQDVIDMPSVIAAVGCSRRTLRLLNRTPRDVLVHVRFSVCPFTFAVGFVRSNEEEEEEDSEGNPITLRLVPLSAEAEARESVGRGQGRVVPAEAFLLPATGCKEVMLEYTPEVAMVAHILAALDKTRDAAPPPPPPPPHHLQNCEVLGNGATCLASTVHTLTSDHDEKDEDEKDDEGECDSNDSDMNGSAADQLQPRAAQEVTWTGSLLITAELATTEYNDAFIIDEFYAEHRTRYPTVRQVKLPVTVPQPHAMTPSLRAAPYLPVIPPLRSRTGPGRVLWRNRILSSAGTERAVLARALNSRAQSAATKASSAQNHCGTNNTTTQSLRIPHTIYDDDDDDDDTDCDSYSDDDTDSRTAGEKAARLAETSMRYDAQTEAAGPDSSRTSGQTSSVPLVPFDERESAARPAAVLLAEEDERRALREYLARRRAELYHESLQTFVPLEVQLRARCGIPRLAVEPSAQGVHLPRYIVGRWCGRSVRLTNHNSAPLCFTLGVREVAYFRIAAVELVNAHGAHSAAVTRSHHHSTERSTATDYSVASQDKDEDDDEEGTPCYRLRNGEALDVVIEVTATAAHMRGLVSLAHPQHTIRGALTILYQPEDTTAGLTNTNANTNTNTSTITRTPAMDAPRQTVPLYVTVANPRVQCSPAQLWFKPGTLAHDGRAQSHYAQRLTLINQTREVVQYTLVPIALRELHASAAVDLSALTPAASVTWARKIHEVMHMPQLDGGQDRHEEHSHEDEHEANEEGQTPRTVVEDAAHFTLEPRAGCIAAASAGGQPGKAFIAVSFHEHSNVRYECAYAVYINGQPSEAEFVLRGDSRETEL